MHQYRLNPERQAKLDAIRASQDRSLAEELALIRLLITESLETGTPGQTMALVESARRLAIDDLDRAKREHDLLDRNVAVRLAHQLGDLFHRALCQYIDDEDLIGGIMDYWGEQCKQAVSRDGIARLEQK